MRLLVSLGFFAFLLSSCGSDAADQVTINGQWELTRALRNNVETGMLDGLKFNFSPDGTLETNLLGNETKGTYSWSGQEITTEGVKLSLTYAIQEMSDSTLHLRSKYQGFQFDFMLERKDVAKGPEMR